MPDIQKERGSKKRSSIRKKSLIFILILAGMGFVLQLFTILTFTKKKEERKSGFSGNVWKNPYQTNLSNPYSEKIALHTHSNEVYFTPERHTIEEIYETYKSFGFSNVAITDYGQISRSENYDHLTGFEWGQNIKKRHILAIGGDYSFSDYFPIYAGFENLNWVIQKLKDSNAFVILPHPKLNNVYTKKDIQEIDGFHAIEVYSPFGDDPKILDGVLSQGRLVHCMANDDLHYFPEEKVKNFKQPFWKDWIQTLGHQRGRKGESGMRYVAMELGVHSQSAVLKNLFQGNYFCVKKYFRDADDPNPPKIIIQKDTITVEGKERYLEIRVIGKEGDILQSSPDTNITRYNLKAEDEYIRLEIVALTGSILSNAIYRSN